MSRLVLLHGFTGAPASWADVIDRLGDDAALAGSHAAGTLAPAAIGHDGTRGPPGVDGFEDEVDRLAEAIRSHGSAPAHLVGYSMGGRLALGLLVRHPALFRSATLIGASPGLADPAERAERAARDEARARLLETEGVPTFVAAWEADPLFASQQGLAPDVLERQRRIRLAHDARGLARALRVIGLARMPDYRPALEGIGVPVRLLVGERDARFTELARAMADRLPRARLSIVPDAGHNVPLERPDEVARLIEEDMES